MNIANITFIVRLGFHTVGGKAEEGALRQTLINTATCVNSVGLKILVWAETRLWLQEPIFSY